MGRTRNGAVSLFYFATLSFTKHASAGMCGAQAFDLTQYICYNQTLPAILCPYDFNLRCGQACYSESLDTCMTSANPPYLIGENMQPCGTTTIQEFDPSKYVCNYFNDGTSQLCDTYHPRVCGIACYDPARFFCFGNNLYPSGQATPLVSVAATKYVTSSCSVCTTYPTPATPTFPIAASAPASNSSSSVSSTTSSPSTSTTSTTASSISTSSTSTTTTSTTTTTAISTTTSTATTVSSVALYETVIIVTVTITIAQPIGLLGQGLFADGSIQTGFSSLTLTQVGGGALTNSQGTLWIYPTLVNAQKIYFYTVGYPPPGVCTVFDVTGVPACPTLIINPQLFIQTTVSTPAYGTGPYTIPGDDSDPYNDDPYGFGGPATQYTLAVADNVASGSSSAALVLSYGTSGSPTVITVAATASSGAQASAYSMFYSQFNSVQSAQSVNNQNLYAAASMFSIAQQASAVSSASAAISSYQSAAAAASASASAFISSYLASQSAASQAANQSPTLTNSNPQPTMSSGTTTVTVKPRSGQKVKDAPATTSRVVRNMATVVPRVYLPERVVRHPSSLREGVKTSSGSEENKWKAFDPKKLFSRLRLRDVAI